MGIFISLSNADNAEDIKEELIKLNKKLSCLEKKDFNQTLSCLNRRIEIEIKDNVEVEITKKYKKSGVQILVTSNETRAEEEVLKYNLWKDKVSKLKKSNAEFFKREIKKGELGNLEGTYYFVVVFQENIDLQKLKEKIKEIYPRTYPDAFKFDMSDKKLKLSDK